MRPAAKKLIAAVATGVPLLLSAGAWIDARYAKAADVREIRRSLDYMVLEIRIGQLESLRSTLRAELHLLGVLSSRTAAERRRYDEVQAEITDLDKQIDRYRARQNGVLEGRR